MFMTAASHIFPFLVTIPALIYSALSLHAASRYFKRRRPPVIDLQPVTILKPVKGMDADSFANFASFCRQEHPCYQIVFAVASPDDPVLPVIRRLISEFPDSDIELVVDGRIFGPNHKVCNLLKAFPKAKHDLIVVCDSDIRVTPRYLADLCSLFTDPAIGLVTSLYRTTSVHGVAPAIEALGFATEMIPNVLVALQLEGLTFALGASTAFRREVLDRIGGFASLVDSLADDYQLGNRVFRAGYRLELSDCFVESVIHRETLAMVFSRQLRWGRTMRVSRPLGYLASGVTQPAGAALCALLAGIVLDSTFSGIAAAASLYSVRCLVATVFSRRFVRDFLLPRYLWLLPVRDLLAFVCWLMAFTGNRVDWRGHRYVVRSGGRIEELS
jgi:ceramide glucosyltransferase